METLETIQAATDANEVNEILAKDFTTLKTFATSNVKTFSKDFTEIQKEYDVEGHAVFDTTLRPKKTVNEATGEFDEKGNPIEVVKSVEVARVGYPAQELIVERAVGFLLGNPVKLTPAYITENAKSKELFKEIQRIWRKEKLDYKNRKIARTCMSEREVAEIWYFDKTKDKKTDISMKIVSNGNGDKLYPKFDEYGGLVMFSREYSTKSAEKTIQHFDVYTAERIQFWENKGEKWEKITDEKNDFGKIPVIYYRQDKAEWEKVQSAIERFEEGQSNHADTNDYTGSPIIVVKGSIRGWSSKGERGKVLELDGQDSQVNYLTASGAPESIKFERDTVKEIIYSGSQTPDISFYEMRNVGAVSGVTLENMYLDARMKAKTKEELFGEMFVRRCNVIKRAICEVLSVKLRTEETNLDVEVSFIPFLPRNLSELVTTLSTGKQAGIISTETAVKELGLAENVEKELAAIKKDADEMAKVQAANKPINENKPV